MIDLVLYEIGKMKWVIVVYCVIAIFLYGLFMFITREFAWTKKKARAFAFLYNLRQKEAIALSLVIGRAIFVLTCAIMHTSMTLGHLICFVLYSAGILACTKNLSLFASNLINYVLVFFLLYIESALVNYYYTIDTFWVVMVMAVNIGLFSVFETALQSISSYEMIVKRRVDNV